MSWGLVWGGLCLGSTTHGHLPTNRVWFSQGWVGCTWTRQEQAGLRRKEEMGTQPGRGPLQTHRAGVWVQLWPSPCPCLSLQPSQILAVYHSPFHHPRVIASPAHHRVPWRSPSWSQWPASWSNAGIPWEETLQGQPGRGPRAELPALYLRDKPPTLTLCQMPDRPAANRKWLPLCSTPPSSAGVIGAPRDGPQQPQWC